MLLIRHQLTISAPANVISEAISNRGSEWWAPNFQRITGPPDVLVFTWDDRYLHRMKVVNETDSRVEWVCLEGDLEPEWIGTQLTFELSPMDKTTLLMFTHSGWAEDVDCVPRCNFIWSTILTRLKDLCETA